MGIFACIPLDSKNFEHRNGVVSLHHKPYKEVNIEWRTFFFQIMNQFLFNKNGSTKLMLERCFKLLFVDEKHKKHMFHLLVY